MAYQNVGTPRFYVDHLLWLKSLGVEYYTDAYGYIIVSKESLISLNPTNPQLIPSQNTPEGSVYIAYNAAPAIMTADNKWKAYTALLGHNSSSAQAKIRFSLDGGVTYSDYPNNYINYSPDTSSPHDGFTLCYEFDNTGSTLTFGLDPVSDTYSSDFKIGCISHGNYYDMPNAPNLSLAMSRDYGGTKEFTTYNGNSMSNTMWSKAPKWGDLGAWELAGDPSVGGWEADIAPYIRGLSKSGRRTWDLKFSYMSDSDLWGPNQMLTNYETSGYSDGDGDDVFTNTLLNDDNFFSQVWHKTLGGTLPFIFQPNSSDSNPDQFAICKIANNSLKAKQTAHNVYDISLKIEEVW
ncbi:hypothetical protein CMI37_21165 [Candidatus Pacearchaeota archaeon]|nr:hypothetical protein [Candidatus Pacearchaeota archaeon]